MSAAGVKKENESPQTNGPKKMEDSKPIQKGPGGGEEMNSNKFHGGRGPRGGGGPRGPGGRGPRGMDHRNKGPGRDDHRIKNEVIIFYIP